MFMYQKLNILDKSYEGIIVESKFKFAKLLFAISILSSFLMINFLIPQLGNLKSMLIIIPIGLVLSYFLWKSDKTILQEISENIIGDITFENDVIEINCNGQKLLINKEFEKKLKIYMNSYFGQVIGFGNMRDKKYGTNNKIEIETEISTVVYYVFSKNINELEILQKISSWCLDNKLNIKEYTSDERTYHGKKLKFSEIQELK